MTKNEKTGKSKTEKMVKGSMKLTRHNGRSGKNGTYNPRHNDRKFDIKNSEHIDEERAKYNVYWDCYQGYHFPADQEQEEKIAFSFEQVERAFYAERYDDFCEGQHERNRKTGHSNRDRTTEDLRMDKKTCPEESLIQIGTMEKSVPPDVLAEIAIKFFEEFERLFGEYVHILDWSLHLDEPTGNLDSKTSQDVLSLLKVTGQKYNQTIVMITHNESIAQMADRIIRIEDGRIIKGGDGND